MSGHSNAPTRDLREGVVNLRDWDGLNEYEQIAATVFEEGIENALHDHPPMMSIDYTTGPDGKPDDIIIEFSLHALGADWDGPSWRFSMKEAFIGPGDSGKQDAVDTLKALLSVARHLRNEIAQLTERGYPHRCSDAKARTIGLDGEDVPRSASMVLMDTLIPIMVKSVEEQMAGTSANLSEEI